MLPWAIFLPVPQLMPFFPSVSRLPNKLSNDSSIGIFVGAGKERRQLISVSWHDVVNLEGISKVEE